MSKYTPTPWVINNDYFWDENDNVKIEITTKKGKHIGFVSTDASGEETEANAQLIIDAVNSYKRKVR